MANAKTITLDSFGIFVDLDGTGGGEIYSDLHDDDHEDNTIFNSMMDALESIILAHAIAGIDIESPAYLEGIETAVNACANNS